MNNPPTTPSPVPPRISRATWDEGSSTLHLYTDQPIQINSQVEEQLAVWFGNQQFNGQLQAVEQRSGTASLINCIQTPGDTVVHENAAEYSSILADWTAIATGLPIAPFYIQLPYGP